MDVGGASDLTTRGAFVPLKGQSPREQPGKKAGENGGYPMLWLLVLAVCVPLCGDSGNHQNLEPSRASVFSSVQWG